MSVDKVVEYVADFVRRGDRVHARLRAHRVHQIGVLVQLLLLAADEVVNAVVALYFVRIGELEFSRRNVAFDVFNTLFVILCK